MATKSKSTPVETVKQDTNSKPRRSKKVLIIITITVIVSVLIVVAALLVFKNRRATDENAKEDMSVQSTQIKEKNNTPPVYIPIDSLVTNLADNGGTRVVQVGLIFELSDSEATDQVKLYLPTIRSSILFVLSKKTSVELLTKEGKDKLAQEILIETTIPFGGSRESEVDATTHKNAAKKKTKTDYPVKNVLFSTIIIQ